MVRHPNHRRHVFPDSKFEIKNAELEEKFFHLIRCQCQSMRAETSKTATSSTHPSRKGGGRLEALRA